MARLDWTKTDPKREHLSPFSLRISWKVDQFLVFMPSLSARSSNIRCFVGAGRLSTTEEKAKQIEQVALSELKRHSIKYLVGDSATELDQETLEQNFVAGGFSRFHAVSPEILNTKGQFLMESWLGRWCAERSLPKESVTALIICDYM